MTQANRGLEGIIANLIDMNSMQRESIDRMSQRMDEGFSRLTASQDHLTQTVDNLGVKIDRLADKIDSLAMVTQAQQVVAQSQTENIAALIAHSNQLLAKIGA